MKKITILLILLLVSTFVAFGQAKKIKQSANFCPTNISMQELRVGMTETEVETAIGLDIKLEDYKELPKSSFKVAGFISKNSALVNVKFYKDVTYSISVHYSNQVVKFPNIDDFTSLLSTNLKLRGKWNYQTRTKTIDAADLRCSKVTVSAVRLNLDYAAVLTDNKVSQIEESAIKARKEQIFKP